MNRSTLFSALALSLALGLAGCGSSPSDTAGAALAPGPTSSSGSAGASQIYVGPGGPASLQLTVPFVGARIAEKLASSVTSLGLALLDSSQPGTVASFSVPVPQGTGNLVVNLVNLPVGSFTLRVAGVDGSGNPVGFFYRPVNLASSTASVTVDTLDTGGYVLDTSLAGTDLGNFAGSSNSLQAFSLACDGSGNLAVGSRDAGTVTVYSPQGGKLRSFGVQEPVYMQGDAWGNFYVNSASGQLQKYAPDGSLVAGTSVPQQVYQSPYEQWQVAAPFAVDSHLGLLYLPFGGEELPASTARVEKYDLSLHRTGHATTPSDGAGAYAATFDSADRFVLVESGEDGTHFFEYYVGILFDSDLNPERHLLGPIWTPQADPTAVGGGVCADAKGDTYAFWANARVSQLGLASVIDKYDDSTGNLVSTIPLPTGTWTASSCAIACDPAGRLYILTTTKTSPYNGQNHFGPWKVSRYIPSP